MDTMPNQTQFVRPFTQVVNQLRTVGLRPTRQRLALAKLLFDAGEARHVSAEALHAEALEEGVRVSLATVYNTLHQFVGVGLLREVVIDANRTYFDTNTRRHHHFYEKSSGLLVDISDDEVSVQLKGHLPDDMKLTDTEVVFHLVPAKEANQAAVNDNDASSYRTPEPKMSREP